MQYSLNIYMEKSKDISRREEIIRQRHMLKLQYGNLYAQLVKILGEYDPIALTRIGAPPNEYEGEAREILCRLKEATSSNELRRIIHEVFCDNFNFGYGPKDRFTNRRYIGNLAGEESKYELIANAFWNLWQEHKNTETCQQIKAIHLA